MSSPDLVIRSGRVVRPGAIGPATVFATAGTIVDVVAGPPPEDLSILDVGDSIILPGLVDTHVHVNDPGRADWEGFETATRAAAAGGVTTIVDMPLNSLPPTVDAGSLALKLAAAEGRCVVDCGFWGGAVPDGIADLGPLLAAGALGAKAFLCPSGVAEFPPLDPRQLRRAMVVMAAHEAPLLVHAESPTRLRIPATGILRRHAEYAATRPAGAEAEAIALVAGLARETGCRVHVVHVSSAPALVEVARAKFSGTALTAETCPHYLTLDADHIADGDTRFKCAPPIRGGADREALWDALGDGTLDLIASDHSPCPPAMKRLGEADFGTAWGGIASLGLGLAAVWTEARQRGFGLADLALWLAEAPARLGGLETRKGAIVPGRDADLVVWDPDDSFTVDAGSLHCRHPVTPYQGLRLQGIVRATFLRGSLVYDGHSFPIAHAGRPLLGRAA